MSLIPPPPFQSPIAGSGSVTAIWNRWLTELVARLQVTLTATGLFTAVAPGIVPASGGGVVNFLRADASWASVGVVTDHGALTGLGDDDHPQYVKVVDVIAVDSEQAIISSRMFGG